MLDCLKKLKRKNTENSSYGESVDQDSQELEYSDGNPKLRNGNCKTSRKKIAIISISIFLAVSLAIILAVVLTRDKTTKVDEYQETQYNLNVKTTITSYVNDQASSTHDNLDVTILALDMKGDKYSLMVVNGELTDQEQENKLGQAPPGLFMSFDVSKSGEILETRYIKANFTNEISTLLTGIIQAFVVDQDSEFDVESECKKTKKGSNKCTNNSKHKQSGKTMFQRKGTNEEFGEDEEEKFEHTSKTWVGKNGKLEKSEINGKYQMKYKSKDSEGQMDFDLKAEVIVVSSKKLTKEQVKELKEIDSKLPEVDEETEYKTKTLVNDVSYGEKSDEVPDLPDYINSDSNLTRLLSESDDQDRLLFDKSFSYLYFSVFQVPFYINTRMYSGIDYLKKSWVCGIHRFKFSTTEVKLLNTDFCISSNFVKAGQKFTIPAWSQLAVVRAYLTTISFSVFTINLNSTVTVTSLPTVETYYNTYRNVVTKMNVAAFITVSVSGEATSGSSKGGVTLNAYMKTNVNDYMVGYLRPFYAYNYLDKSFQGEYQIWVQYLTVGKNCFDILTVSMCVPDVQYSDQVTLVKKTVAYQYYPEQLLFSTSF